MLTGTLIFFTKQDIFGLLGFTESLFPIIHKKHTLMQDLIEETAEAYLGGKEVYLSVICIEMAAKAKI